MMVVCTLLPVFVGQEVAVTKNVTSSLSTVLNIHRQLYNNVFIAKMLKSKCMNSVHIVIKAVWLHMRGSGIDLSNIDNFNIDNKVRSKY